MANIIFEFFGTLIGAFIYLLSFKLLFRVRQRFPFQTMIAGAIGFAILTVIIFLFSRHPDVGHIATTLGVVIAFIAFLLALFASRLKLSNFLEELSFVFMQMALGLAILALINTVVFEISPYLGFDNAFNDKSAYLVTDPLQYSYIAAFIVVSVIHPIYSNKLQKI